MKFVPECVGDLCTYVPICINCYCTVCEQYTECEHCNGETEDGGCCVFECPYEDNDSCI